MAAGSCRLLSIYMMYADGKSKNVRRLFNYNSFKLSLCFAFVVPVVCVVCVVVKNVRGIAWKAILSEAVVTEGEALGVSMQNSCLEGSTSYQTAHIARYCLTDSSPPCT